MFQFIKNLFTKPKVQHPTQQMKVLDENGEVIEDDMLTAVLNQAFTSGKPVIANRKDDGSFEMKEINYPSSED